MSEWREVTGRTREEAVQEAVKLLGVAEADMEVGELPAGAGEVKLVARVAPGSETEGSEAATTAPEADRGSGEEREGEERAVEESDEDTRAFEEKRPLAELLEDQKDVGLDFLVDLLEAFDLEGEIAAEIKDGVVNIDISGDELGSLIGRRGKTLNALGEVSKTVVQRRTASRVRLNLDVQGYRVRRREVLERYAAQLANEVRESSIEKALEPMSASERKIVHDVVAKVDGVRSYSEGSEPKRNVVISPV